jgi:hypothetical protein
MNQLKAVIVKGASQRGAVAQVTRIVLRCDYLYSEDISWWDLSLEDD